jgi:hypothetical protein
VGRSEFDPKTAQEDGWRDMSELPGVLDEHKESHGKSLESRSFADVVEGAEWVLWELKPIKRAEYARQLDLFVGKSGLREIWEATHGGRFFEERFVANGETLAYVKLDGRGDIESEKFEDKASIEDALDEALRADDLGAFIGGGTGLAYSYIDVVLTDVVRGVETIRRVLANGNVTRRCWILFEDAHLEREWVPLYADSPLPPTEEESEPLEAPT